MRVTATLMGTPVQFATIVNNLQTFMTLAVLEKLNQVANAALQDEAVKKSFATMGVEGVGSSPQQFSALIKDDLQRWATLIKEKNIKLD